MSHITHEHTHTRARARGQTERTRTQTLTKSLKAIERARSSCFTVDRLRATIQIVLHAHVALSLFHFFFNLVLCTYFFTLIYIIIYSTWFILQNHYFFFLCHLTPRWWTTKSSAQGVITCAQHEFTDLITVFIKSVLFLNFCIERTMAIQARHTRNRGWELVEYHGR